MYDLKGKKVVVVGLGSSGMAAARYAAVAGAQVTVSDAKPASGFLEEISALKALPITFSFGGNDPAVFHDAQMAIVSPGIPLTLPGLGEITRRGGDVIGEMELAVSMITKPIIAVTGTNGKTTTTSLLGHLFRESGFVPCVAGNIGTPILDLINEAKKSDIVVLEVSSFQIETTPSIAPRIAILLNITQDHLDRHVSFAQYAACKGDLLRRVSAGGDCIFNAADAEIMRVLGSLAGRKIPFDPTGKKNEGTYGWYSDGALVVRNPKGELHRYPLKGLSLQGEYNRENMLAALISTEIMGVPADEAMAALTSFRGLPHRVEFIAEHGGIKFYDDSKGTNVGATAKAIEGFSKPVILIAGGLAKGADFSPLAKVVKERVKKLILIGRDAAMIERAIGANCPTVRAASMDDAVEKACAVARPSDVVLLSPACASFDMFRDYADRGRAFAEAVEKYSPLFLKGETS